LHALFILLGDLTAKSVYFVLTPDPLATRVPKPRCISKKFLTTEIAEFILAYRQGELRFVDILKAGVSVAVIRQRQG
jgi:hypothetical protein